MEKKATLKFSKKELSTLAWVGRHLVDGMFGDDRHDHGFNRLKDICIVPDERKKEIALLFARINRLNYHKKW
jgi:hypothetical protein